MGLRRETWGGGAGSGSPLCILLLPRPQRGAQICSAPRRLRGARPPLPAPPLREPRSAAHPARRRFRALSAVLRGALTAAAGEGAGRRRRRRWRRTGFPQRPPGRHGPRPRAPAAHGSVATAQGAALRQSRRAGRGWPTMRFALGRRAAGQLDCRTARAGPGRRSRAAALPGCSAQRPSDELGGGAPPRRRTFTQGGGRSARGGAAEPGGGGGARDGAGGTGERGAPVHGPPPPARTPAPTPHSAALATLD